MRGRVRDLLVASVLILYLTQRGSSLQDDVIEDEQPALRVITSPPQNSYAYLYGSVTLVCESHAAPPSSRIIWYEYTTGAARQISDDYSLLPSHPNYSRYRLISTAGTVFHLQIIGVTLSDAGTYACYDLAALPPDFKSAELVVLASDPYCFTTVPFGQISDGQSYSNYCGVETRGALRLNITWSGPDPYDVNDNSSGAFTNSALNFTAHSGMHLQHYSCRTTFSDVMNFTSGQADNIPTYEYTYAFDTLFYLPVFSTSFPPGFSTTSPPTDTRNITTPHMEAILNASMSSDLDLVFGYHYTDVIYFKPEVAVETNGSDYIPMSCLRSYAKEFRQNFREITRRLNAAVNDGLLCPGASRLTFFAGDTLMSAANGQVDMKFVLWLQTNRDYPMMTMEQCSWQGGAFLKDMTNWRLPVIPGIYNCPLVTFAPNRFDNIDVTYICRIQEPKPSMFLESGEFQLL